VQLAMFRSNVLCYSWIWNCAYSCRLKRSRKCQNLWHSCDELEKAMVILCRILFYLQYLKHHGLARICYSASSLLQSHITCVCTVPGIVLLLSLWWYFGAFLHPLNISNCVWDWCCRCLPLWSTTPGGSRRSCSLIEH